MKFYRYRDIVTPLQFEFSGYSVKLDIEILYLRKETNCGYWISPYPEDNGWEHEDFERRWVSKTSRKRYAYPTKEEAMDNFKHRKAKQKKILSSQLAKVTAVCQHLAMIAE